MAAGSFRRDDGAVGQVVAFLVAGAVFLASIATVLAASQGAATDAGPARDAAQQVEAGGLADVLVSSPGVGWTLDADQVQRLGLSAANGSGLDPARLEALRGAMADARDNGKVDYEEALRSLGMDPAEAAGFHLRIYPVGLDDIDVPADTRVAYIADWTSLVTVKVPAPVLTAEKMAVKANAALDISMVAGTVRERQAIRDLGVDFTDRVYITAGTPTILVDYAFPLPDLPLTTVLEIALFEGDVYPDHKPYLDAVLPGRLSQYDVVIVGSGVDHGNLVGSGIKEGVKDWVLDGGTLIVLGSADRSTAWLNPLLNVGVDTVNGAPAAPDVAHPLLKEPNDLSWTSYDTRGQGWDIQETGAVAAYGDFSHVVLQDGKDVLAVSKQSAFADGHVFLTSYHARDIAGSLGQDEATAFLENMIAYSDRSRLYLDYGGIVPADQTVALAVRQGHLWDDTDGQVPVRIEVLVWG